MLRETFSLCWRNRAQNHPKVLEWLSNIYIYYKIRKKIVLVLNMWAQKTFKIVTRFITKIKSMYHMQMWHVWLKCCGKGNSLKTDMTQQIWFWNLHSIPEVTESLTRWASFLGQEVLVYQISPNSCCLIIQGVQCSF